MNEPKTFHEAYRAQRALGKGKIESLRDARVEYPELNKAYCLAQERHDAWALEPLDERDHARDMRIRTTGKLE